MKFFPPEHHEIKGPDGFVLRPWRPGDAALRVALSASYEHLRPWMPWARPAETLDEGEYLCRLFYSRYVTSEDFTIAVLSSDESRLLGGTGFHLREGGIDSLSAELGLFVVGSEAGRGLGTRIVRAMIAWGFSRDWPFVRLAYRCDARNLASRRVAEKAGMLLEGTLRNQKAEVGDGRRDTLCFAAQRDEWHG